MHKFTIAIVCSLFICNSLTAQPISSETAKRLYYTAKVWGFLKYYHPGLNWSKKNADPILLTLVPRIIAAANDDEFNSALDSLFNFAGPVSSRSGSLPQLADREKRNFDLSWFHSPIFSSSNAARLDSIYANFRQEPNNYYNWNTNSNSGYIYSIQENLYATVKTLKMEYKLMYFFRYWNIVNYYYPYKYAMDRAWDSTLLDFIPKCLSVTTDTSFHLFFAQLQSRFNDSHGFTSSSLFFYYFGSHYFPFYVGFTEGKTVIIRVLDSASGVKQGDVIIAIDGVDINHFRDSLRPFAGGSNPASVERNTNSFIERGKSLNSILLLEDGSGTRTVSVSRKDTTYPPATNVPPVWKILPGNVGYVDMGRLQPANVDSMYSQLKKTKAIIFDTRNYPNGTMYAICAHILREQHEFVKFTSPVPNYPGTLIYEEPGYSCGPITTNDDWYQGKVLILMNEQTQSHAEFTIMSLKTHPNAITIGSQTAGADGNVIAVNVMGGLSLYYTSIGVYYPDWSETQRIGIKPDIEVKPTVLGIREGRDEVLEKALSVTNGVAEDHLREDVLNVFPNPTIGNSVSVSLPSHDNTFLRMFDALGREMYSIQVPSYDSRVEISTKELSGGVYYVTIGTRSGSVSTSFVKTK